MLTWIIQITIISLILIFLVHHLIIFFTETLTVPKIKYLENDTNKKYESIYHIIFDKNNIQKEIPDKIDIEKEILDKIDVDKIGIDIDNSNLYTTDIHSLPLPINNTDEMKNELKSFLKNQLNTTKEEVKEEENVISFYQL